MRLRDKIAIVTGSSRGIGKAIALALAREGAHIVVAARTEIENPRLPGTIYKTAEEVQQLGQRALALRTDVGDEQSVEEMIQRTLKEFGKVDILVNNAATGSPTQLVDIPVKRWDLITRINLRGTFLCTKGVLPNMMKRREGSIINLSSIVSTLISEVVTGIKTGIAYDVTKAGIDRFTFGLAEELKEYNIAANALRPHHTASEGWSLWNPDVDKSGWQKPEMWGRYAVFLAAQDAKTLTGKTLLAKELEKEAARLQWAF